MDADPMGCSPHDGTAIDRLLVDRIAPEVAVRRDQLLRRISELTDRDVRVVAVTKGHPPEVAVAAYEVGFRDLGENYAQELLRKVGSVAGGTGDGAEEVRWHFVGRLQSNKVRQLVDHVYLWQSIDRLSLIRELAKRAPGAQILIQVDLAGIDGRGGADPAEVPGLVAAAGDSGLLVRGLMGVADPHDVVATRRAFARTVETAGELGLAEVSIGMSGDMEDAIAAGATMVRIGTGLFGARDA